MRKSFLKAFGYFACFAWSSLASAVGFGGINVTSSLGQPLVAEIELVAVDKADKSSLNAHLASPDAFKGAGIDYPYNLPKIKFQVESHANGVPYIKATTDQAVNEPFVSLLLELTWSSGRLLREYTFLLDPPGFVAEQPPVAAVKPIEPVLASAVAPAAPIAEAAPVAASAPVPSEPVAAPVSAVSAPVEASPELAAEPIANEAASAVPAEPAPAVSAEPVSAVSAEEAKPEEPKVEPLAKEEAPVAESTAKNQVENKSSSSSPITVKNGDTLSKIANQTKAPDVSLERMLVALYRANANEFEGRNMNRIKTGKILRLPETDELAKLKQAEAVKEIHAQVADWNAYRQKLAAANAPVAEQQAKQEVAGKISTSIADKAPVAKESAKEVLKLSKGDALGDKAAAGGKGKTAQEKAMGKEEDAIAKAKALKEAEQRTALLEKNVKDMQRLVELKNQAAAKSAQDKKVAASAPANTIPLIASSASATSTVAVAQPKPKVAAPKVLPPPPSLMDDLLDDPIYLGGGAAILLGLGGVGFALLRRKKQGGKKQPEDKGSVTGKITAPTQSSPDTGDFTHTITAIPATTSDAEEVDPIGEADLFLNFGRDVQAEEVLKEALNKNPSNNQVRLKLLSIYAARKDTKSFYVYALEVKESGDAPAWQQAAAMGRELEPNNAFYGESSDSSQPSIFAAEAAAEPSVDFDLGFGGGELPKAEPALDFNKTFAPAAEKTSIMSASDIQAAQEAPMDFDVTGTHPGIKAGQTEEPNLGVAAMDFDVSGANPADTVASGLAASDLSAMDFDVTGGMAIAQEESTPPPALNLDDLVFDVPSSTPAEKPGAAAPVAAPDSGMDFMIDFPTEAKPAANVKAVGLSDISLDLDSPAPTATPQASETKDEHWQEVATKLDLAKAYQEMGDQAGAREILEEVVRDGDATQRETAETLLKQLA